MAQHVELLLVLAPERTQHPEVRVLGHLIGVALVEACDESTRVRRLHFDDGRLAVRADRVYVRALLVAVGDRGEQAAFEQLGSDAVLTREVEVVLVESHALPPKGDLLVALAIFSLDRVSHHRVRSGQTRRVRAEPASRVRREHSRGRQIRAEQPIETPDRHTGVHPRNFRLSARPSPRPVGDRDGERRPICGRSGYTCRSVAGLVCLIPHPGRLLPGRRTRPYHRRVLVLMPVPDRDFDVTEVAVPWRMLTGVLFGRLGAADEPKRFYDQLTASPEFRDTSAWADLDPAGYDGLILPGGHAPGMRQYLGSEVLQNKVAQFWKLGRPVGAICHGVLVLARTKDPQTSRSVLADRRTTCLLKYQERGAYLLTAWRLGRYYRTYPQYVEDEVRTALASPEQLERGPRVLARGTATDDSARWPGDAYLFAKTFLALLQP